MAPVVLRGNKDSYLADTFSLKRVAIHCLYGWDEGGHVPIATTRSMNGGSM